jgi:Protein of unknown function (DUF2927)
LLFVKPTNRRDKKLLFFYLAGMMVMSLKASIAVPGRRVRGEASGFSRWIRRAAAAILVVSFGSLPARAENPDISSRRAAERTDFTNDEIKDGFFKIAFGAELQIGAPADRVRKFDEPIRIFVESTGLPDRRGELAEVVADIRSHVKDLDIAVTNDRQSANFVVHLVPERKLKKTIRARYGSDTARHIEKSLNPECLSGIGKDERFRIRRAEAILPVDAGDFTFYDCAYEELLQALGAINDDASVPWTMFNDDVQMGFFDIYDQYLLNILYDPRIRPGMTRSEAEAVLADVLSSTRAWVREVNRPRQAERERPVNRN